MQTIDLSNGGVELQDLLRLASEDNLILRTVDGRKFVLADIDNIGQDIELVHGNRELTEFVERRTSLRQAKGMWKDRDDLPLLEQLRGE